MNYPFFPNDLSLIQSYLSKFSVVFNDSLHIVTSGTENFMYNSAKIICGNTDLGTFQDRIHTVEEDPLSAVLLGMLMFWWYYHSVVLWNKLFPNQSSRLPNKSLKPKFKFLG